MEFVEASLWEAPDITKSAKSLSFMIRKRCPDSFFRSSWQS